MLGSAYYAVGFSVWGWGHGAVLVVGEFADEAGVTMKISPSIFINAQILHISLIVAINCFQMTIFILYKALQLTVFFR